MAKVIAPPCTTAVCTDEKWCEPQYSGCKNGCVHVNSCKGVKLEFEIPVCLNGFEVNTDDVSASSIVISGISEEDGREIVFGTYAIGSGITVTYPDTLVWEPADADAWPSGTLNATVYATINGETIRLVQDFAICNKKDIVPEPCLIVGGATVNEPFAISLTGEVTLCLHNSDTGHADYQWTEWAIDWGDGTTDTITPTYPLDANNGCFTHQYTDTTRSYEAVVSGAAQPAEGVTNCQPAVTDCTEYFTVCFTPYTPPSTTAAGTASQLTTNPVYDNTCIESDVTVTLELFAGETGAGGASLGTITGGINDNASGALAVITGGTFAAPIIDDALLAQSPLMTDCKFHFTSVLTDCYGEVQDPISTSETICIECVTIPAVLDSTGNPICPLPEPLTVSVGGPGTTYATVADITAAIEAIDPAATVIYDPATCEWEVRAPSDASLYPADVRVLEPSATIEVETTFDDDSVVDNYTADYRTANNAPIDGSNCDTPQVELTITDNWTGTVAVATYDFGDTFDNPTVASDANFTALLPFISATPVSAGAFDFDRLAYRRATATMGASSVDPSMTVSVVVTCGGIASTNADNFDSPCTVTAWVFDNSGEVLDATAPAFSGLNSTEGTFGVTASNVTATDLTTYFQIFNPGSTFYSVENAEPWNLVDYTTSNGNNVIVNSAITPGATGADWMTALLGLIAGSNSTMGAVTAASAPNSHAEINADFDEIAAYFVFEACIADDFPSVINIESGDGVVTATLTGQRSTSYTL